jgi:hypothetical protein
MMASLNEKESLRQQEIEMTVNEAENKKLAGRSSAFWSRLIK